MFFEDPYNHVHCIYVLSCILCARYYSNMLKFGLDRCVIVGYGIVCSFRGVQFLLGKVIGMCNSGVLLLFSAVVHIIYWDW